jgi:hypothetical protein
MFSADHSIQDLEPSAGQVLETCHTLKRKDFLMDFKIGLNDKGGVALPKGAILGNQIDLAFRQVQL